ncbi:unnamed protein product [Miscanthus lutarioriparius]|uniref:BZIP domain-containing protein n=1 Tax=Miscanthus lutarioriparius TaxID=422564 RepID=A0A811M9R5_9POAL|nr:unnamed protein product [Miscanthus lutarioriparius]
MNGVGDAHAAAMMQQALRMSLPMAQFLPEQGSAKLTRPPGLPPTPPQAFAALQRGDVCMEAVVDPAAQQQGPRKAHRRSRSDVPFGYFPPAAGGGGHGHHQLPPPKVEPGWGGHLHGGGGGGDDDLFNARGSSMKTNGADSSENESEECAADSRAGIRLWTEAAAAAAAAAADRREGLKRTAAGEPAAAPLARHARSLSMDSLIGKLNFSAGATGAANGVIPGPNMFKLEFGSGEFTPVEMKKIMANEKLAEMALADPKRVKRVLANRQSAARSKERKMRYIAELEQKVQILQTEATTLSAQLRLLQRDSAGIATQNNELKFRLQAMEQQAQLRDALNDALTGEVQRLKLATAELGDSCSSNNLTQQIQISVQEQMFHLHQQQQQQATPIPFYQLQQAQQNGAGKKQEPQE